MDCEPFLDGCIGRDAPEDACARARNVANLIVAQSINILNPWFCPGSSCGGLTGLVSHGPPAVDQCNMVASWVSQMGIQGQRGHTGSIRVLPGSMVFEATITSQLFVGAYPELTEGSDGLLYYPDPSIVDEASQLMATMGESWYVRVIQAIQQTEFMLGNWGVGPCQPLEPMGGCVGWQFEMTVTL